MLAFTCHGSVLTLEATATDPVYTDPNATVAWTHEPKFKVRSRNHTLFPLSVHTVISPCVQEEHVRTLILSLVWFLGMSFCRRIYVVDAPLIRPHTHLFYVFFCSSQPTCPVVKFGCPFFWLLVLVLMAGIAGRYQREGAAREDDGGGVPTEVRPRIRRRTAIRRNLPCYLIYAALVCVNV